MRPLFDLQLLDNEPTPRNLATYGSESLEHAVPHGRDLTSGLELAEQVLVHRAEAGKGRCLADTDALDEDLTVRIHLRCVDVLILGDQPQGVVVLKRMGSADSRGRTPRVHAGCGLGPRLAATFDRLKERPLPRTLVTEQLRRVCQPSVERSIDGNYNRVRGH